MRLMNVCIGLLFPNFHSTPNNRQQGSRDLMVVSHPSLRHRALCLQMHRPDIAGFKTLHQLIPFFKEWHMGGLVAILSFHHFLLHGRRWRLALQCSAHAQGQCMRALRLNRECQACLSGLLVHVCCSPRQY